MDIHPKTLKNVFIPRSDPGIVPVDSDPIPLRHDPGCLRSSDELKPRFVRHVRIFMSLILMREGGHRSRKKTPGGIPAGGLIIPGFFPRGRQA
jgi:hypothetical protein